MKYATWLLDFTDPRYGTGPEQEIRKQGETATGAWVDGNITDGGTVLGYFTGDPPGLDAWSFTELTQEEALKFVSELNSTAYVAEDGIIQVEITGA